MDDEAGRWMTFAEPAKARGTSKRAAVVLDRRHGWRKQRNNAGHVVALVPHTWAEPAAADVPEHKVDDRAGRGAWHSASTFADALAEANRRADAALALADRTLAQLADATARLEQAESRADAAHQRADRAEAARQRDQQLITNLEAGLRAKASEIAEHQAAAERARAVAQEATQAAATLRDRLTGAPAELTQQLDQARQRAAEQEQAAQEALQAAETPRQATANTEAELRRELDAAQIARSVAWPRRNRPGARPRQPGTPPRRCGKPRGRSEGEGRLARLKGALRGE